MYKRYKKQIIFLSILFIFFCITSCADVAGVTSKVQESPYGFWYGLWHGFILFFSFIGSLFSDDIAIYGCFNNGGWYDFGFFLGVGGLGCGCSKSSK